MPHHHSFVAIDFETANPKPESACALGVVHCEGGRVVDRHVHLIRPPHRHFTFTHIHGLTWINVADAPDFATVWVEIAERFAGIDFIAAHNARFDGAVLDACCRTYGLEPPEAPFVCTVRMSRAMWSVKNADLASMARFLCIPLDHHEALSDATACAEIVLAAEIDGWRFEAGGNAAGQGRSGREKVRTRPISV
jgi:DNA polymerase-3 subunit epsilon